MARPTLPAPNLIDRVVEYFSPVAAANRMQARMRVAMATASFGARGRGGFNAARKSRTSNSEWRYGEQSADAALLPDLPDLRDASRDLERNTPLASGAISTVVTNVVGPGLRLRPMIDRVALGIDEAAATAWEQRIEREWSLWADSQECDLARTQRFDEYQRLAFRSHLTGGDCFVVQRFLERPGSPFGLKLQILEGDRISNPNRARDTNELAAGVQLDATTGAPTGYHVTNRHPGDGFGGAMTWSLLPAFGEKSGRRLVLHLYRPTRPEQRRGIPYLAPVVELLKQLSRYSDAEIMAAVITSCFAVVTKTDGANGMGLEESPTTDGKGDKINILNPGTIVDLGTNENLANFDVTRPNAGFDPFVQAILRQIGVALELPFEVLIKHFTASYSAARAALLEAWKFFREYRQWLAAELCQPVYETFVAECVARGRIAAPGFFADPAIARAWCGSEWIGPAPGQIDPGKEADANATMVDRGWKTDAQVTAEMTGGDWERNVAQRGKEVRLREAAGLPPVVAKGQSAALPAPAPQPGQDGSDKEVA